MAIRHPCGPNGQAITDDKLLITMGVYEGISGRNINGTNLAAGTAFEDIWIQGGTWAKLPAATTLECASSHADDTAAGDGVRTIEIQGLDASYNEITEVVSLSGQTPVLTTNLFLFVNLARAKTGGDNFTNTGDIYVADDSTAWTSGVPDTAAAIQSKIAATQGESQQAIYTVPAGYNAYLTDIWIVSGATKVVDYELHETDHTAQVNRIIAEGEETNALFEHIFDPYRLVEEKHTLSFDAHVASGSAEISAGFDLILVHKQTYDMQ